MARGIGNSYIEGKGIERDDLVEVTDIETGNMYPGYYFGLSSRFLQILVPDPDSGGFGVPQYTSCSFYLRRDLEMELVKKFRE